MHGMSSSKITKNGSSPTLEENEERVFKDKRRMLSYWKSLGSSENLDNKSKTESVKNELTLIEELKKSFDDMDVCFADVILAEKETNHLREEELKLVKELEHCMQRFVKEKETLDLNDNIQSNAHCAGNNTDINILEREVLQRENERLTSEVEKLNNDHKSSKADQQHDIEKLTREVQTSNISRRKMERELSQALKSKDEQEIAINALREELENVKKNYENEVKKLNAINEKVLKDNSQLVEKGKEATESLKIAVQQLTEEKKSLKKENKPISHKENKELEISLEKVKKERENFRQRCEKSEMLNSNLQQEVVLLQKQLKDKEKELVKQNKHGETTCNEEVNVDTLNVNELQSAQSRITQLKNYVHVLEGRVGERDEIVVKLRKENAKANDLAMEKSLELSRSRRMLEKKIEKLVRENSEWKRKFLIPDYDKSAALTNVSESTKPVVEINNKQQTIEGNGMKNKSNQKRENVKHRRKSDPDKSVVEKAIKRTENAAEFAQKGIIIASNLAEGRSSSSGNTANIVSGGRQNVMVTPVEVRAVDVAPKRRIGGKFIRSSTKRHSADLGKLMSRHLPQATTARKSDSDLLRDSDSSTIFVNRYRRTSDEEHWV